jgi:hypothetical protein
MVDEKRIGTEYYDLRILFLKKMSMGRALI